MAINGIGQNDLYLRQQQAAALAVNSGAIQPAVSRPAPQGTSSTGIDFVKFGELVRSNALKNAGVTPVTSNPVTASPKVEENPALQLSAAQVKNIFGLQPEYKNADAYKNFAAVTAYDSFKSSAANDDYSKYDALANFKINA